MDFISLFELNGQIQQTLKREFADAVWVTAEIASIQEHHSGHCYLELADKSDREGSIVAVAKGTVWAFTYRMLKPYFETTTGRKLEKGMKVLLKAEVVFHEIYGYSLNVKDIDPTFTIGDLERKRREILELLEKEGIIDMNRNLEFPEIPKNIAVISSPTAAGYGDFINQLQHNTNGYAFHTKLFPALMQGDKTADSVIAALDRIYEYESLFDVVVIIRGGGSQTDLGYFDSYEVAANVAQFPLPVIAGIGHERDETIVDRVAYMRVKTPTAAAVFLIDAFRSFDERMEELRGRFRKEVRELMEGEHDRQQSLMNNFRRLTSSTLERNRHHLMLQSRQMNNASRLLVNDKLAKIENIRSALKSKCNLYLECQRHLLEMQTTGIERKCREMFVRDGQLLKLAETTVKYVDPRKVLERGYSITRCKGETVRSFRELKSGDEIETLMIDGSVKSMVE